jgi:hypothetical protein
VVGELDAPGRAVRRSPLLLRVLPFVLLAALPAEAHVGSPTVVFDGVAGPYPLRVIVRMPGVIPGRAEVAVRLAEASADSEATANPEVTVQPVRWDAPKDGGAPPPDVAHPVRGEPGLFTGWLWLMTGGSYSVRVAVKGAAGTGEVFVPVAAVATQRLQMQRVMGGVLLFLAGMLVAGGVSLVGAAAREAVVPEGAPPDTRRRWRARLASVLAAVVIAAALWGGWAWWGSVDAAYRRRLYRPPHVTTVVRAEGPSRTLRLTVDDEAWRQGRMSPLTTDHGKLMHLFLVREPGLDAFAHLHPVSVSHDAFEAALPPIPAGPYRLYADVTHESGFAQTLTDRVAVPETTSSGARPAGLAPDPDDSWWASPPAPAAPPAPATVSLGDGLTLETQPEALRAGVDVSLRFRVRGPAGRPARLEPYMGMLGHAIVMRPDGTVFAHLHPSGTISMASQLLFEERAGTAPAGHEGHVMGETAGALSFPYVFPKPGRYRQWVQVKADGQIRTAVLDAEVR